MQRDGREIAGLLACALGALLMAHALFGHAWLMGEYDGLDVHGGVIDVHLCSKPDDPDRLPMSIGDLEGCMSRMYAQSELRAEAGSWFGATTHMTLLFGAGATCLFLLLAAISGLGLEIEVVPRGQPLALHLFDLRDGALLVHADPGVLGTRLLVTAGVGLAFAVASAPARLSVGSDVLKFVAGALLALGGTIALDPGRFQRHAAAAAPETLGAGTGESLPEPLPEAEIEVDDSPRCVKCEGGTRWLEKAGRHRCTKCGLYQPLHAPGSQVDR